MTAIDLQAQIREALESNVMLEAEEDEEAPSPLEEMSATAADPAEAAESGPSGEEEPVVEIGDDWPEPTAAASDSPWAGSNDDREQELADESGQTLAEHLLWQLELAPLDERQRTIGRAIIDSINDDGYLTESLDDVAATLAPDVVAAPAEIEAVLGVVQQFDPLGVGARSVAECIGLQLEQLDPATPGLALAREVARHHLQLVADQLYSVLRRQLACSPEELETALLLVRGCHPRPGSQLQFMARWPAAARWC